MDFENSAEAEAATRGLVAAGVQAQMAKVSSPTAARCYMLVFVPVFNPVFMLVLCFPLYFRVIVPTVGRFELVVLSRFPLLLFDCFLINWNIPNFIKSLPKLLPEYGMFYA